MVSECLVIRCVVPGVLIGFSLMDPVNDEVVFYCVLRVFIVVVLVLLVLWLVLDTRHRPEQLISFGGVCMFIVLGFLLSANRTAVSFTQRQPLTLLKNE